MHVKSNGTPVDPRPQGQQSNIDIAGKAAEAKAHCERALTFEHGIGCLKDNAAAAASYRLAAEAGDAYGAYKLALMLDSGMLGPRNGGTVATWLERAAEGGLAEAQLKLATICEAGQGVGQDLPKAAKWYARAAEQNSVEAAWRLASMHDRGYGIPINKKVAAALYTQATEAGHLGAHYDLAILYLSGQGLPVDVGEALRLLTVAAQRGHKEAREKLAQAQASIGESQKLAGPVSVKVVAPAPPPEAQDYALWHFVKDSARQACYLVPVFLILLFTPLGTLASMCLHRVGWMAASAGVILCGLGGLVGLKFFFRRVHVPWSTISTLGCVALVIALIFGFAVYGHFEFTAPVGGKTTNERKARSERLLQRVELKKYAK